MSLRYFGSFLGDAIPVGEFTIASVAGDSLVNRTNANRRRRYRGDPVLRFAPN